MCLISILKKGTVKYSDEVTAFITSGFNNNYHGSGFMYKRHISKTITVSKGYYDLTELLTALKEANLGIKDELVIHHRISTGGSTFADNCHPYVCSKNHEEVAATNITTNKPCLVHNGTFTCIDNLKYKNYNYSDTYAFSRYIMSNKNIQNLLLQEPDQFAEIFKSIINKSRIAILFPNKDVVTIGEFTENNGYLHSNEGYFCSTRNVGGVNYYNQYEENLEANRYSIKDYVHFDFKDFNVLKLGLLFPKMKLIKKTSIYPGSDIRYATIYTIKNFDYSSLNHLVSYKNTITDKDTYKTLTTTDIVDNYYIILFDIDDDYYLYEDYKLILDTYRSNVSDDILPNSFNYSIEHALDKIAKDKATKEELYSIDLITKNNYISVRYYVLAIKLLSEYLTFSDISPKSTSYKKTKIRELFD